MTDAEKLTRIAELESEKGSDRKALNLLYALIKLENRCQEAQRRPIL
jgi:hypothetical protein